MEWTRQTSYVPNASIVVHQFYFVNTGLASMRVESIKAPMTINSKKNSSDNGDHRNHEKQTSWEHYRRCATSRFRRGDHASFVVNSQASDYTARIIQIVISTDEISEDIVLHPFLVVTATSRITYKGNPRFRWICWGGILETKGAVGEKRALTDTVSSGISPGTFWWRTANQVRNGNTTRCAGNIA